ncbi:hypothetical protein [Enterococcus olivae]
MKKGLVGVGVTLAVLLFWFVACVDTSEVDVDLFPEESESVAESSAVDTASSEVTEDAVTTFTADDSFSFTDVTINPKSVTLTEEDGSYYATLELSWINDSLPQESKFTGALTGIDVQQDGELLTEVSGAYADTDSDVHFPNAVGGEWGVKLTYELLNAEDEIAFTFVPADEHSDSETITVQF